MSNQAVNEERLTRLFEHMSVDSGRNKRVAIHAQERLMSRMRKRAGFVDPHLPPQSKHDFLMRNFSQRGFVHGLPDYIVEEARRFIRSTLENYTTRRFGTIQTTLVEEALLDNWSFGPGGSFGTTGTHAAVKYEAPFVCTESCEPYVKRLRARNPYFTSLDANRGPTATVLGSKLTTVPKNEDTVRIIAIEPIGNMALQLAAGKYIQDALCSIGLDITTQELKNKNLAKLGSITGALCTVDLSAASDMISLNLIASLWPEEWNRLFLDLRSPFIKVNDEFVELNFMSTMGNGFTFPMMTLTILALVVANRFHTKKSRSQFIDWGCTAVYGDDIIIPTSEYSDLCVCLRLAGLVVNTSKSYSVGPFRESCGGDYHYGLDITPIYVENLRYDHEIYVALNKLIDWCGRHKVYYTSSVRYLLSLLRLGPYFVPFWCSPDSGLRTTRVARKYKMLRPVVNRVPYEGAFIFPLAAGGYITDIGFGPSYTPRERFTRMCTKVSRLPKGYLDGADATSVTSECLQIEIDFIISLCI